MDKYSVQLIATWVEKRLDGPQHRGQASVHAG